VVYEHVTIELPVLLQVYGMLLGKALQQDTGEGLALLLQRIPYTPGSAMFGDKLNLVNRGAVKEIAAELPRLLEIGLPPHCKASCESVQLLLHAYIAARKGLACTPPYGRVPGPSLVEAVLERCRCHAMHPVPPREEKQ
jgi:hypothetical protein